MKGLTTIYAIAPTEEDGLKRRFTNGPYATLDGALAIGSGGADCVFQVEHNGSAVLRYRANGDGGWRKAKAATTTQAKENQALHDARARALRGLHAMAQSSPWAKVMVDQVELGRSWEEVLYGVVPKLVQHNMDLERDLVAMKMVQGITHILPVPLLPERLDKELLPTCPDCGEDMLVSDGGDRLNFWLGTCTTCLKSYLVCKEAKDDTPTTEAPAPRHV